MSGQFTHPNKQKYLLFMLFIITALIIYTLMPVNSESSPTMDEITLDLNSGWNMVSIPFIPVTDAGQAMKASDLFDLINQQGGGCLNIIPYTSGWIHPYDPNFMINNFEIIAGTGYAIECKSRTAISLKGPLCKSRIYHFLKDRFYFVGIVGYKPYTAHELSKELSSLNQIIKDRQTIFDPLFPISDFELKRGNAYFIKCNQDTDWWYVETKGEPLYDDANQNGIYLWLGDDGNWNFHIDPWADVSTQDSINGIPLDANIINKAKGEKGYAFFSNEKKIQFDFVNSRPENIHVGIWGSSPDSSSFSLNNDLTDENIVALILDETSLSFGQTTKGYIYITNPTNLFSVAFHLRFNPNIIEVLENSVNIGSLFSDYDNEFAYKIWNDTGDLIVGITNKGGVPGITKEGTYILLDFEIRAKGGGGTTIGFERNGLYDNQVILLPSSWFGNKLSINVQKKLTIQEPSNYSIFHTPRIPVNAELLQYYAPNPDVTINNIPVYENFISEGHYTFNLTQLPLFPYLNYITAKELNQNLSDVIQVYYVPRGTTFAITSHYSGQVVNSTPITLQGTTDDLDARIMVYINQSEIWAVVNTDGTFVVNGIELQEGKNELAVTKFTLGGTVSDCRKLNIYLDRTPPLILIQSPDIQQDIIFDTRADFIAHLTPFTNNPQNLVITNDGFITLAKEDSPVWKRYTHSLIANLTVTAIGLNTNNGDIWLGTSTQPDTQGANIYCLKGQEVIPYSNIKSLLGTSLAINDVLVDETDKVWFATNSGLLMFDNYNWYLYTTNDPNDNTTDGAYKLDADTNNWKNEEGKISGITNNIITCLALQKVAETWNYIIATDQDITFFDGYDDWYTYSSQDITQNESQEYINIRDVIVDEGNDIWIAACGTTEWHGLYRYNPFGEWENKSKVGTAVNMGDMRFRCLTFDDQGKLWIGTEADGLFLFDGSTFIRYDNPGIVDDLAIDHEGIIWAATPSGLFFYDNNGSGQWTRQTIQIDSNDYGSHPYTSLCMDKGRRLFGSQEYGLFEKYLPYKDGIDQPAYLDLQYCLDDVNYCYTLDWLASDSNNLEIYVKFFDNKGEADVEQAFTPYDLYYTPDQILFSMVEKSSQKRYIRIRVYLLTADDQATPSLDYLALGTDKRIHIGKSEVGQGKINITGLVRDVSPVRKVTVSNGSEILDAHLYLTNTGIDLKGIDYPFMANEVPLQDGENTLLVEAVDGAGNISTKNLTIIYNSQEVSVKITSPQAFAVYDDLIDPSTKTIEVQGVTTGTGVKAYVNGNQVQVESNGTFMTNVTLGQDEQTIRAVAVDNASNWAENSVVISVFRIISPVDGFVSQEKSVKVKGILDNDFLNAGIAVTKTPDTPPDTAFKTTLSILNRSLLNNGQFIAELKDGLTEGENYIFVKQESANLGVQYRKIRVYLDDQPPTVIIDRSAFTDFIDRWVATSPLNDQLWDLDISAIAIDSAGLLWLGTNGEGIRVFDTLDDTSPESYTKGLGQLSSNYITDLHIQDDAVWIATKYGGVTRCNPSIQNQPSTEIRSWSKFNKEKGDLAVNYVTSIAADIEGNLWFGTLGGGVTFYHYRYQSWDKDAYRNKYNSSGAIIGNLSSNNIFSVFIDPDNNKWFGSHYGIVNKLNSDNQTWEYYKINPAAAFEAYVSSITMDEEGSLWFTTYGGGLSKLDSANNLTIYSTPALVDLSEDMIADPARVDGKYYLDHANIKSSGSIGRIGEGSQNSPAYIQDVVKYRLSNSRIGGTVVTGYQDPNQYDTWKFQAPQDIITGGAQAENIHTLFPGYLITYLANHEDSRLSKVSDFIMARPDPVFVPVNTIYQSECLQSTTINGLILNENLNEKWLFADDGLIKVDAEGQWINYTKHNSVLVEGQRVKDAYLDAGEGLMLLATNKGLLKLSKVYHYSFLDHSLDISGLVWDSGPLSGSSGTLSVEVNNLPATIENGKFLTSDLILADGLNTIKAIAEDQYGNRAEDVIYVYVGEEEDFISETGPDYRLRLIIDEVNSGDQSVYISWSPDPAQTPISYYEYFLEYYNDTSWVPVGEGTTITQDKSKTYQRADLAHAGKYRFSVRAQGADHGLLSPWAEAYFSLGPSVNLIIEEYKVGRYTAYGEIKYKAEFKYQLTYDRAEYPTELQVTSYINGLEKGNISGNRVTVDNLTEGKYTLCLEIPSIQTVCLDFFIDYQPPQVTFTDGIAYDLENDSIDISWIGDDAISDSISYEYKLESDSLWQDGSVTSVRLTNLSPGVHLFHVKAADPTGNSNTYTLPFTVGGEIKEAPEIRFIEAPPLLINYNTVIFHWSGSDYLTPSEEIEYSCRLVQINKQFTSSAGIDSNHSLPAPELNITWADLTGVEGYEYSYTWDNKDGKWSPWAQEVGIHTGQDDPNYPNTPVSGQHTLYVKRRDAQGLILSSELSFDIGDKVRDVTNTTEADMLPWSEWSKDLVKKLSGLPEGQYCFYLKARDSQGNISKPLGCVFTIDLTPPSFDMISPPDAKINTLIPAIGIKVKNEIPGAVIINGQAAEELPLAVYPDSVKILYGYYDLERPTLYDTGFSITVVDLAGNMTTKQFSLEPITILSPESTPIINYSPISILGSTTIDPTKASIVVKGVLNQVTARIDGSGRFMADGLEIQSGLNEIKIELIEKSSNTTFTKLFTITGSEVLSRGIILRIKDDSHASGLSPLTVAFEAELTFPDESGSSIFYFYEWDFDGDGRYELSESKLETKVEKTFTYSSIGLYQPRVRVILDRLNLNAPRYSDTLTINVHGRLESMQKISTLGAGLIDIALYTDGYYHYYYVLNKDQKVITKYKMGLPPGRDTKESGYPIDISPYVGMPTSLAIDASGALLVADSTQNRVVRLTHQGYGYYSETIITGLNDPFDLVIDDSQNIYINNLGDSSLHVYQLQSGDYVLARRLDTFTNGLIADHLRSPKGLAILNDYIYLVDSGNRRILKFALKEGDEWLVYKGMWGGWKQGSGNLENPQAIGIDPVNNYFYVIDYPSGKGNSSCIQVYNRQGRYRCTIDEALGISFNLPSSLALVDLDDQRFLYLVNKGDGTIEKLTGNFLFMADEANYTMLSNKIVFIRGNDIYAVNDDQSGSDLILIFTLKSFKTPEPDSLSELLDPAWYPDGSKLIFVIYELGWSDGQYQERSKICMINADGSNFHILYIFDGLVTDPSFNLEGDKIIFCGQDDNSSDIYLMEYLKGGGIGEVWNLTTYSSNLDDESQPCWAPNSKKIVYNRNHRQICVADVKKSLTQQGDYWYESYQVRPITPYQDTCEYPSWSRELSGTSNSRVAYIKNGAIYYVEVNANDDNSFNNLTHEMIINPGPDVSHPTWGSNGDKLAYIYYDNIYRVDLADTQNPIQITHDFSMTDKTPNYSLDGVPSFTLQDVYVAERPGESGPWIDAAWEDNLMAFYSIRYQAGSNLDTFELPCGQTAYQMEVDEGETYMVTITAKDSYGQEILSTIKSLTMKKVWASFEISRPDPYNNHTILIDPSKSKTYSSNVTYEWIIDNDYEKKLLRDTKEPFYYTFKKAGFHQIILNLKSDTTNEIYHTTSVQEIEIKKGLIPVITYEIKESPDKTEVTLRADQSTSTDARKDSQGNELTNRVDDNYAIWSYQVENPLGSGNFMTIPYPDNPVHVASPITIPYPYTNQDRTFIVTLTIRREGSEEDTETLTKFINIKQDRLQAIIDYKILPDKGDGKMWIKFDASRSLGRNIDWSRCDWQFDSLVSGGSTNIKGLMVIKDFPKAARERIYTATLTIYRGTEVSTASQSIDISADELKAIIDYKMDESEELGGKRVVFCSAENSLGSDIAWNRSQWTALKVYGDSQGIVDSATGPTAVLKFPANEGDQNYLIKLTIYRVTADGTEESHTTTKSIKITADPLQAVINYTIIKEDEQDIEKNIVLLDAYNSQGADIDWSKCEWSIDGNPYRSGPSISYVFDLAAREIKHAVTLVIHRYGNEQESDTVTRYIMVKADPLKAVIDYNTNYQVEGAQVIEGKRMVFCSAKSSLGSNIQWSRCEWTAHKVHGDNPGIMDKATGPTAILRFPADELDWYYIIKLTIYRIGEDGAEETDTTTKYIKISSDPLLAVINSKILKEEEAGLVKNIVLFDAFNSVGSDIDLSLCEWAIDGKPLPQRGPAISYDFGYTAEAVVHSVTLTIQRAGGTDYNRVTRYIILGEDELKAEITIVDDGEEGMDNRLVTCRASESQGQGIEFGKSQWIAYKVEGDRVGEEDRKIGEEVTLTFPAYEENKYYVIKLTVFRFNAEGIEETATTRKVINIEGDPLKAAIDCTLLRDQEEGVKKNIILLDASNSLGSDIDWANCQWEIDGKPVGSGPSISYDLGYESQARTYAITLRIQRFSTNESDQVTKSITIAPDELEAVITVRNPSDEDEKVDEEVIDEDEEEITYRLVQFSAARSKGHDIRFPLSEWMAYRIAGEGHETMQTSNIGLVDSAVGEEVYLRFPPHGLDQEYLIKLTIFRSLEDGPMETATTTKVIRIGGDPLSAIINYKLLKEEEDGLEKNIILLDAYNSLGSDIYWSNCNWSIDGKFIGQGPMVSYKFDQVARDIKYAVTLVIYRMVGNDQESATATKYIDIEGDRLEAVITYEINEFETESDDTIRINSVILDARNSAGSNINWDKCMWYFDNGQVLQGPTVMYRYQAQDQAYKHPVMLVIYRDTDQGEESDSCLQYIRIGEDPLVPIISLVEVREDSNEEVKDKRTVVFSARDSRGSGIIWERCKWTFGEQSNKTDYGATASYAYYLLGEDHWYPVTLTLCRRDIEGNLVYSEPKKQYFKIEGDKLEADFNWTYLGNGKVQFDATSSKGLFIDWSVCHWDFGEDSDEISTSWQESHGTSNTSGTSSSKSSSFNLGLKVVMEPITGVFGFGKSKSRGSSASFTTSESTSEGGQNSSSNRGSGPVVLHQYTNYALGLYYPVTLTIYRRDQITGTYSEMSTITKWVRPESLKITQPEDGTTVRPIEIAPGQFVPEIEVQGRIDIENVCVFVNNVMAEISDHTFKARIVATHGKMTIHVKAEGATYNNFMGEDQVEVDFIPIKPCSIEPCLIKPSSLSVYSGCIQGDIDSYYKDKVDLIVNVYVKRVGTDEFHRQLTPHIDWLMEKFSFNIPVIQSKNDFRLGSQQKERKYSRSYKVIVEIKDKVTGNLIWQGEIIKSVKS